MKKILFVCTGNTCRSSMAEGIFNTCIARYSELAGKFTAVSAGISAYEGDTASENAIQALSQGWGIDISRHRSKGVTDEEIESAYLILTMTRGHKNFIVHSYPYAKHKVFTLKEFTLASVENDSRFEEYNYNIDITDPYGMSLQIYGKCAEEIKEAVDRLISKLKNCQ